MEKAFAKLHGNYARIVAGDPIDGINTIQGGPNERYTHADASVTQEDIWNLIVENDPLKAMLTGVTSCASGSDDTVNDLGLVNCHVYPILGYDTLNRNGQRLVKLRNPWGRELYYGPYSDNSNDL